MKERDMRPAVTDWLVRMGYRVGYELSPGRVGFYADVVGVLFAPRIGRSIPDLLQVVAVELKLRDLPGVLAQARWNAQWAHASYAAMPAEFFKQKMTRARQRHLDEFGDSGIGLLSVNVQSGDVRFVVSFGRNYPPYDRGRERRYWWRVYQRGIRKEIGK